MNIEFSIKLKVIKKEILTKENEKNKTNEESRCATLMRYKFFSYYQNVERDYSNNNQGCGNPDKHSLCNLQPNNVPPFLTELNIVWL